MRRYLTVVFTVLIFVSCRKEFSRNASTGQLKKGVYIINDKPGSVLYSSNMKTFERITYQTPSFTLFSEAYYQKGKLFVFAENPVFGQGGTMFTSSNAANWEGSILPANSPWRENSTQLIIPFKNGWVGLLPGKYAYTSSDGITWKQYPIHSTMKPRVFERYYQRSDTLFMYGGEYDDTVAGLRINASDTWMTKDGIEWRELPTSFPFEVVMEDFSFAMLHGKTYAFGLKWNQGTLVGTRFLVSGNGYTWTEVENAPPAWAYRDGIRYNAVLFVFNSRLYLLSGLSSDNRPWYKDLWSYDGVSWVKEIEELPFFTNMYPVWNRQQIVVVE